MSIGDQSKCVASSVVRAGKSGGGLGRAGRSGERECPLIMNGEGGDAEHEVVIAHAHRLVVAVQRQWDAV